MEVATVTDLAPTGVLALLQAAVIQFVPEGGVELRTRTDAPLCSGLGTSGALGTALAFTCQRLQGHDITPEEAARLLEVSPMTVKRRWRVAKGWLHRRITERP